MKHRASSNSPRGPALLARLGSASARRIGVILFMVLLAITGGSARSDALQLAVLRPAAVLLGGYALLTAVPGSLVGVRRWLALLGLAALTIALHLLPLPPAVWHSIPGRESIVAVDALLGLEHLWRPLALSPEGAWNALFSLIVPISALLLYAGLQPSQHRVMIDIWLGCAVVSAVVGLAQVLGIDALYFYSPTNRGMPVGLLANANHQAAFLAASLPLLAFRATSGDGVGVGRAVATGLAMVLFVSVILLTGSRAGMALGIICFALALATIRHLRIKASDHKTYRSSQAASKAAGSSRAAIVLAVGAVLSFLAVIALLIASKGLAGLTSSGQGGELRIVALPTIFAMLERGWLLGFGAGSFPPAFQLFEPTSLLSQYYLNHAHNDWLEPVLDFGVAGIALMVMLIVLVARACLATLRTPGMALLRRLCLIAPAGVFALASLVDYPLRTPFLQVLALWWLATLGSGGLAQSDRVAKR